MGSHEAVRGSVAFVNTNLIGKTFERAEYLDDAWPVERMRLVFTDGTTVLIESEHDEGWLMVEEVMVDLSKTPEFAIEEARRTVREGVR